MTSGGTDEPLSAHGADPSSAGAEEGGVARDAGESDGEDALGRLQSENADLKDRLLRALADGENFRDRTERAMGDVRRYAVTELARDMAEVVDNFDRALASVSEGQHGIDAFATLHQGIELTRKELLRALERHGIRRFEPLGETFDPNLHEAVLETSDQDAKPGTVAQVVSPGYMVGSRVLRPAKVGVAGDPRNTAS